MGDYRRLRVWQGAYALTLRVYKTTATFPSTERYALADQLRRASTSIAANIAEGSGRESNAEFARFLRIARGSLHELTCQLMLAADLGYVDHALRDTIIADADAVGSALVGLIRARAGPAARK